MDYDKLIEASLKILDLCMNAAAAIKTLRAENEKLKEKVEDARLEGYAKGVGEINADLARVTAERDAAVEEVKHLKAVMRDEGIVVIPPKYPWEKSEWNV